MAKKTFVIAGCILFLFSNPLAINLSAEADENVKIFLNNFEEAIYKMDTYRCIMLSEYWKGAKHEKRVTMFQFKKPNLMRMDVLEGKKKGSTVALNKKGKIRGRNSWGLTKTLRPTDKRIQNIRGTTFLQASLLDKLGRLKEHILKRGCKTTIAEEERGKSKTYHLHIDYSDVNDPVTSEDIWFDRKTYIILRDLRYEAEKKVADVTRKDFEVNIPLNDEQFEL